MKYILPADAIENMPGIEKTHFLNANAIRTNKSLGDETGLTGLGFHLIEIAAGCESTEYHVHYHEDECVYILSGDATVTIDDCDYPVSAGDFIGYPAGGLPHTMKNTGTQVLRCLVAGQRLAQDIGDYPRKQKRIYRSAKGADVVNHAEIESPRVGRKK